MVNKTTVFNKIVKIVSFQSGMKPHKISENTSIGRDLGMDGDDVLEILEKVCEIFNLDQGGQLQKNGQYLLKDGTMVGKHFSKFTGEFTIHINQANKIFKIRITP